MKFTHLQAASGFSMMNSTMTVDHLVSAAKKNGFDALALTDENVLHGAVTFYQACQRHNIKPLLGMTVYIDEDDEGVCACVLLAKSNAGYDALIKLSTYIQNSDNRTLTKEKLSTFTDQMILIVPALHSLLSKRLLNSSFEEIDAYLTSWQNIVSEGDFYIGVEDHGMEMERKIIAPLKAYAEARNVKVVAINDVRYIRKKDVIAYDCLQAMKHGKRWQPGGDMSHIRERHLRSSEEMAMLFDNWPEVLEATEDIKESCHIAFNFNERKLPAFPVPVSMSAHDYLEHICLKRLPERYHTVTKTIEDRLMYELGVIQEMGFSDYFLIVHDFVAYAKQKGILVGPGRGSAAGSIVAYVLSITEVDPVKYNLLFERFLNPERISMPDIDIDFSDTRRDEVIAYVRDKYGADHVAQIITFGTFAARSLLRELIKTIGIDQQDAYFILNKIPVQSNQSIVAHIQGSEELSTYIQTSRDLKTLFTIATVLEGLPRHVSTHAAGVVISEQPLSEHVPLISSGDGTQLTQYAMNDLEQLGLLKMDFLGLRNLTLMEKIIQTIKYKTGKDISLQSIPDGDQQTYQLLQSGMTNGVFQLESKGMQNVLQKLKPTHFEDVVAVNALYRPGPMDNIPTYIARKHGAEACTYPHPEVEPILANTYGVLVYQEQIMLIAHKMARFSLGEADVLRRAVSKKQHHLMDEQREKFVVGSVRNGYNREVAEEIFSWIVKFSNYGFNRSHAVAYSKISYQLAYLKAHYPLFFFAELLSSVSNQEEKVHMYVNEAKQFGLSVLPPSINKSYGRFSVENKGIRIGLLMVKGVGRHVVNDIMDKRKTGGPFSDLFDFCLRVPAKIANRKVLENLILAGVFDELHNNRASLLASIDQAVDQGELFKEFQDQPGLFHEKMGFETIYTEMEDFSPLKKLADEKEFLGIYVSSHPLTAYRPTLHINGFLSVKDLKRQSDKRVIKAAVIVQSIKVIRTKRGDPMAFLTLSDETGEIEAVAFPNLYRDVNRWLEEEMIVMFSGKREVRNNQVQMILNTISVFESETLKQPTQVFIKLVETDNTEALAFLRQVAQRYPGESPIIVHEDKQKKTYQLSNDYKINPTDKSMRALESYFGGTHVVLRTI
ncbi:DNA polymerase III subunit alpha [Lentibacillus saliphilus]|uniref:DNA polymerase III subunit alpha n=1 Tax=Lentibacillus saliphilus TaxID=2737028 RepID=UPI001C2F662F|nr:DNA polymerase III subunit alpha [Lentibacillus saliphilus]